MLSYEDRLRVWMAALLKGMAYWNGRGLLIAVRQAVEELNGCLDLGKQMRAGQLKRIVAEFKDTAPPYSSFDLKMRAATRRAVGTEHSPAVRPPITPQISPSGYLCTGHPQI